MPAARLLGGVPLTEICPVPAAFPDQLIGGLANLSMNWSSLSVAYLYGARHRKLAFGCMPLDY